MAWIQVGYRWVAVQLLTSHQRCKYSIQTPGYGIRRIFLLLLSGYTFSFPGSMDCHQYWLCLIHVSRKRQTVCLHHTWCRLFHALTYCTTQTLPSYEILHRNYSISFGMNESAGKKNQIQRSCMWLKQKSCRMAIKKINSNILYIYHENFGIFLLINISIRSLGVKNCIDNSANVRIFIVKPAWNVDWFWLSAVALLQSVRTNAMRTLKCLLRSIKFHHHLWMMNMNNVKAMEWMGHSVCE